MPRKTTGYHGIVVPSPYENYADKYKNFVEAVDKNLPKLETNNSKPAADADSQDHLYMEANKSGSPMAMYVSDGDSWVKQSIDTPEVTANTVAASTGVTDGSGNTVVDTSSADNTLQNASLDGSNVTNSNGNSIVNTTSDELQNITVPESTLNFTGLSDGGTVTGTITMTNSLVFDRGNDDTDKVEIVDVTSATESASVDSVANPALEVRQPDNSNADLRVTGTIKEV